MTQGELQIHKDKIKKVMIDYLTRLGWPKIPNERVMQELKPMWILIEEAGLILPGMNYPAFVAQAQKELTMANVKDILGI